MLIHGINENTKAIHEKRGGNRNDELKYVCVCMAPWKGHLDIVKMLIENYGADVNIKDDHRDGKTPLHCAMRIIDDDGRHVSENDQLGIVKLLIEKGAQINAKDNSGDTPFHLACSERHLEIVKYLIENGAEVDAKNNNEKTPLQIACERRWFEAIKLLIEQGADINIKDEEGMPLLHRELCWHRLEVVQLLIIAGADISFKYQDEYGDTIMHQACTCGHLEIVKTLIEHDNGANLLNARDNDGQTPLHWTTSYSENDNVDMTKLLIENGADINAKTNQGSTPLHSACKVGRLEALKLLIENGAKVNAKDNDGKTPLHEACEHGNLEKVQLLLSRGANVVNNKTTQGSTPLHVATEHNHLDVVWFLVRQNPSMILERLQ